MTTTRPEIAHLQDFDKATITPAQLKRWRKRRKLSQDKLAQFFQQLGYSTVGRTVRRWENGERKIPLWVPTLIDALDERFPHQAS